MTRFCTSCGAVADPGTGFCTGCGAPMEALLAPAPRTRRGPASRLPWLAIPIVAGVGLAAVLTLNGGLPKFGALDDGPFLDSVGFNEPITLSAQLNTLYQSDPTLPDQPNTLALIFLTQAGAIAPVASPGEAPWWQFAVKAGVTDGAMLKLPLAHRQIIDKTEVRQWTEGSSKFFAETVNYSVVLNDSINGAHTRTFGPFSIRLVLVNTPQDGHWVVQTPSSGIDTLPSGIDGPTVINAVSQEARGYVGSFQEAVNAAKLQAYDAIEKGLRDNQVLERGDTPNVLISKRAGLAFYIAPNERQNGSIGDYISYCRGIRTPKIGPWRLPADTELAAATEQRGGYGMLIDTPDRRLWGEISSPPAEGYVMVPTATMTDNSGNRFNVAEPPAQAYGTSLHIYTVSYQGLFQNNGMTMWTNTIQGTQVQTITYERPTRIFCVADLSNRRDPAVTESAARSASPAEKR